MGGPRFLNGAGTVTLYPCACGRTLTREPDSWLDCCAWTVGSMCSGIGGLDLGLEWAGMRVAWQSEIDPHCCRVLARHWPTIPNHGDIHRVDWEGVERVDVISAGYPCQPFSVAGRRRGDDDPRHLWPSIGRAIRLLRPRCVLLENVPGHLSLGFGQVLSDLADVGYDAEWDCIPAAAVGAQHLRYRLFVVAWPTEDADDWYPVFPGHRYAESVADADRDGEPQPRGGEPERGRRSVDRDQTDGPVADTWRGDGWTRSEPDPDPPVGRASPTEASDRRRPPDPVADADGPSRGSARTRPVTDGTGQGRGPGRRGGPLADPDDTGPRPRRTRPDGWARADWIRRGWTTEPDVGRMAHGVPDRLDRLRGLGNAVVPQVAELVGSWILEANRTTRGHRRAAASSELGPNGFDCSEG